jgi:hypothetical protein
LALALGITVIGGPAAAQGKGKEPSKEKSTATVQAHVSVDLFDNDREVRVVRDYYSSSSHKPKPLPPGIAKNLARGKPLPPGIAKQALPVDLNRRLPVREGTERVLAGDKVILVRSGIVVDVFAIFKL